MTENELRQKVSTTAQKFIGVVKDSVRHQELLKIYNSAEQLPRGYRMSTSDPWCACFVSAISLQCGLTDIMPIECSCGKMVQLYQKLGRWMESDSYKPNIGDVIFYYWSDPKNHAFDQTGAPNHVGIVTELSGNSFTVIEGNRVINGVSQVAYRSMDVDGRYIRGFGLPDYASKASKPKAPWYEEYMEWGKKMGISDGTRPNDNMTRAEAHAMLKRLYDLVV